MKRVFIIGANRGIGMGFARKFSSEGWEVYASVWPQSRNDESSRDLEAIAVNIFEIDYLDETTIVRAAEQYGDSPLDCFINCAGISGRSLAWEEYDSRLLTEYFQIMVVGPFLATKHFRPSLEKSANAKIVNISSRLGSISENIKGTKIAYKIAKAGLNQETRTIAIDFKNSRCNIMAIAIDPGAVATRLSGWQGKIDLEQSVDGMYSVIDKVSAAETGTFWRWNGEQMPF
ncbi:short chain dehydrogenase [Byssothecium circinans]|uniref:Short chain dehydrogenase n=1 Tax=Byssothecium circinans TaxID=147558 RepID=A0A6A5TV90_9PLEO|nr:short chain dehydrogenase [Byssothecium circinans]